MNELDNYTGTRFEDFVRRFTSNDWNNKLVNVIDPLQTFDVQFKFFPTKINENEDSFIKNIAEINSLVGKTNDVKSKSDANENSNAIDLNLSYYVQSVTIPGNKLGFQEKSTSSLGNFFFPDEFFESENKTLQMTVLNTKASLHERIFYPWMREVTLPFWSYNSQPYTTANITVDFTKHSTIKYLFVGCRPVTIDSLQASQEQTGEVARKIVFLFDAMFILSNLETDY